MCWSATLNIEMGRIWVWRVCSTTVWGLSPTFRLCEGFPSALDALSLSGLVGATLVKCLSKAELVIVSSGVDPESDVRGLSKSHNYWQYIPWRSFNTAPPRIQTSHTDQNGRQGLEAWLFLSTLKLENIQLEDLENDCIHDKLIRGQQQKPRQPRILALIGVGQSFFLQGQ